VSDRHVAVAASAHPKNAAPITGAFVGKRVATEMTYSIRMNRVSVNWQVQSHSWRQRSGVR
jgi:hypothetical protein